MIFEPWARRLRFYVGNGVRLVTAPWRQRYVAPAEASTIFGCSFGSPGWHHLRETLKEYDSNPRIRYSDTSLYRFLTHFQPPSICDLLPQPAVESPLPLFLYPWGTFRQGELVSAKNPWMSRFCGPSSEKFISDEFDRTIQLYHEVRRVGYRPWQFGNTFIGGTFLRSSDGASRFVVLQGNHRMAILAHLGEQRVAVRNISGYLSEVREHDCLRWPLVANNQCSKDYALRIFRLFFTENGDHVRRALGVTEENIRGQAIHYAL